MKLIAPRNIGGSSEGADEANIAAFENSLSGNSNDFQVLVREHFQNSSDAFFDSKQSDKLIFKVSRTRLNFENTDLDGLLELYKDYYSYTDEASEKVAMKQAIDDLEGLKGNYNNIWAIRFEDNSGGLEGTTRNIRKIPSEIIVSDNLSNKKNYEGSNSKGSFGIGKMTAFTLLNKTFTVFYYNRNSSNDSDYILGKVRIPTFFKNEDGRDIRYGKNAFIGQPVKYGSDPEFSDWSKPYNNHKPFRSIATNGLTTIIPQFHEPTDNTDEWPYLIAYSMLHSFFKMFENDEVNLVIKDDFTKTDLQIDKSNYQEIYESLETKSFITDEEFLKNKYDYLVTKPFIQRPGNPDYEFNQTIGVTSDYTGNAKLSIYANPELEELIENNKKRLNSTFGNSSKYIKTFRLLRDGMLLRDSYYPN